MNVTTITFFRFLAEIELLNFLKTPIARPEDRLEATRQATDRVNEMFGLNISAKLSDESEDN